MDIDRYDYRTNRDIALKREIIRRPPTGTYRFSTDYISRINHYKSLKSKKWGNTITTIGGVLMLTGLASAAQNFMLKDDSSRKTMAISGGIQFGVGLIIGLIGHNKTYEFRDGNEVWRIAK